MIFNANTVSMSKSFANLPNMGGTIRSWFRPLSVGLVTKQSVNYEIVETVRYISGEGVIQPLSNQQLMMKPEGQRSWIWNMLHCSTGIDLATDQVITIDSIKYRVMARKDYYAYGYLYYELAQDYSV